MVAAVAAVVCIAAAPLPLLRFLDDDDAADADDDGDDRVLGSPLPPQTQKYSSFVPSPTCSTVSTDQSQSQTHRTPKEKKQTHMIYLIDPQDIQDGYRG